MLEKENVTATDRFCADVFDCLRLTGMMRGGQLESKGSGYLNKGQSLDKRIFVPRKGDASMESSC